jgi:hypothetical protein
MDEIETICEELGGFNDHGVNACCNGKMILVEDAT